PLAQPAGPLRQGGLRTIPARLLAPPHQHGARRMNPRVVVLTTYFRPIIGGVESNAERLARYLHANDFAVRVVTKRINAKLADRETVDGVPIERIGPYGERSASGKWRLLPSLYRWLVRNKANYDVACCVDYRGVGVA